MELCFMIASLCNITSNARCLRKQTEMYDMTENQLLTYKSNVILGVKVNMAASANRDGFFARVAQNWRTIVILLSEPSLSSGANNVSYHSTDLRLTTSHLPTPDSPTT
jgi:hypothetical protein